MSASQKELRKFQKDIEKTGARMADAGAKLTAAITAPLIGIGAAAIKGAMDQRKAMAQVEAALLSMGAASGRTAAQLAKNADALEMRSLADADEILTKVTANLLTFGNVSGKVFDRAQQAVVDIAQRMGGDLQSAALMVGKALNDPTKGLSALRRVGIQFTAQQEEQIKAMVKAGNAAGAQSVMLSELERQFGGAAAAAANVSPWRQAEVAMKQAGDTIGEALLPIIPPIANAIRDLAMAFGSLTPQAQRFVLIGGAIAAALGPALVAFGALASAIAPALAGLAALTGATGLAAVAPLLVPIAAAAGAVYLAFNNWDKIEPKIKALRDSLSNLKSDFDGDGKTGGLEGAIISAVTNGAAAFNQFAAKVQADAARLDVALADAFRNAGDPISAFMAKVSADAAALDRALAQLATAAVANVKRLYAGVKTWIGDKLNAVWASVTDKIETVKNAFFTLYDAVVGHSYIPDMVDGIGQHMKRLDAEMVAPAKAAASAAENAFRELATRVQPILDRLFPGEAAFNKLKREADDLAAYAKKAGWTPEQAKEAQSRLRTEGMESAPIDLGAGDLMPANDNWIKPLESAAAAVSDKFANPVKLSTLEVAEGFAEMARDVSSSLQGLVSSIKSGDWLSALTNVLDLVGQVAGIIGGQNSGAPRSFDLFGGARAKGGPVVGGKSYLVGEKGPEIFNPGRSGAIVPNHMLGESSVVRIEPSAYFDVVVDGRAANVAAPMAARAQQGAIASVGRGQRRRLA